MNRLLATAAPLIGSMTIAALVNGCSGSGNGGTNIGGNPVGPTPVAAVCARIETQTTSLNPRVGETAHVGASAFTASNTPITPAPVVYVSSNTAVATVNAAGAVTAVTPGTVVITVTCTNGGPPAPTATVSVTVLPQAVSLVLQKTGQGDGFLTSNPAGGQFDAGARVTITAAPNANSTFAAWGGACAGQAAGGPCVLVIAAPGPVTVTANFGLYTFVANIRPIFQVSRPNVNCTWNTTAALRLAFTFAIGVGNVPSGSAAITGAISAPSPSAICNAFNSNVNVNLALGGTTGAMTFAGVLVTAESGNQYRGTFNGVYNSINRTVSGSLQITYGGVDGNGSTTVNITAQ